MIPSSEHPCSGYRNLVPLGTLEAEPRIRCKRTNERTDGGELKGKFPRQITETKMRSILVMLSERTLCQLIGISDNNQLGRQMTSDLDAEHLY